ncbi:MAG: CXXX repeat peptide maturase [Paludibacteraceae bacterium]|nr:CXXX repeat peptide maturase [Paludibacteraceae bacterium]
MLQYLIILLDDTSTSFCHYECTKVNRKLISLENLREGIFFAMEENMMIQFVYPDYNLPQEYEDVIESIDHSKIKPASCCDNADVVILNSLDETSDFQFQEGIPYVLRIDKENLFSYRQEVRDIIEKVARLNVVITDIDSFTDDDFTTYKEFLSESVGQLIDLYTKGMTPQFNLLTDRMMLHEMNNCNAGHETLTLAPDGNFYVCPAFYYASPCDGKEISLADVCKKGFSVGSLEKGLDVKNKHLYKIDYAPICRICDAFQCKRCAWLNRKTTLEVNTPSRQQCVVAHIERNASRMLLEGFRKKGFYLPEQEIKEIDYLDPFEIKRKR